MADQQTITLLTQTKVSAFVAVQTYSYDSLSRLKDATENITPNGGSQVQSWKQTFTFDRYGNSRFDFTNGNTTMPLSSCAEAICNPTISTSNNRMASTGWEYDSSGNTTGEPDGRTFVYDEENKLGAAFISAKTQLCRLVLAERFAVKFCRCFKHRIRSVFAYWQKRSFMPDCFPHR